MLLHAASPEILTDADPRRLLLLERAALSRITRSKVKIDHWDYPKGSEGNATMLAEYRTGGQRKAVKAPTRMKGATFFDVLQQTDQRTHHDELRRQNRTAGELPVRHMRRGLVRGVAREMHRLTRLVCDVVRHMLFSVSTS